ncbi:glycosyltransferase family 2 protein [Mangrovimonas spongiae]|uniref:Glycosyltransferase family 2 protein n=1 Tax=Mangrovimonas spongiae TaxID=2494697 RepID=A0A428JYG1_9FLAO|nr:glycosyltransferase family A protein [Mangrovimonas spongiae]RSK39172.1 glycosyltransferase family 2 protein [Mangrovimonas spongiae]
MLSILIPTYNYNAYPLAKEIEKQAIASNTIFEIICIDDGSNSPINVENQKINTLKNSVFIENNQNIGSLGTRVKLASKANYNWLLFLDADTFPKNHDFLSNYLKEIPNSYDAFFGGFAYKKSSYSLNKSLRYTFGKQREEVCASIRNKTPYKIIISANFLIKKTVYLKLNKNHLDNNYGMDYLLGSLLKTKQIKVKHINNEVYHYGLDDNYKYLEKTKRAVETLAGLYLNNKIPENNISLIKAYQKIKNLRLHYLFGKLVAIFNKPIEKNLKSHSPSLFLFDLYRLGYFCKITS